ncbi:hypothetical protein CHCC15075_1697 [Bacillus licheniformis]|uniref:XkdX family protein n=1 Tax=Bacillus licheniformis TaxID=1402 RepID=A0AB37GKW9_BACLI|nr:MULTISPECIES: XkdX family protein [Bacillus]AYC54159.1 XkdX family protein [Bacillus licheniformis]MDD0822651.1 XkdX family protein [Bacillus cereus]MED1082841.1 XkdX family protein [Bacillus licheniformis]QPR70564.1 XkdX family protein [Bacillus licheniformis]TWL13339.1 hypothetical protein CHCC16874_1862 [Bacillus licheniformis]
MKYPDYETIKVFWDWGCYEDYIMRDYVEWGYLTPEEYEKITGWSYSSPPPSDGLEGDDKQDGHN